MRLGRSVVHGRVVGGVVGGVVAAVSAVSVLTLPVAAAAEASLRIEPAAVAVARGQSFWLKIVQDASQATSGAQASIGFDPTIIQVESVKPGPAYASAPILLPDDLAAGVVRANDTGRLAQIAAAWTPPDAVPAGPATFLLIQFRVTGCGETDIVLPYGGPFDAQLISGESAGYGSEVPVVTADGHVTTCASPDRVTSSALLSDAGASLPGPAPVSPIAVGGVVLGGLVAVLGALAWRARRHPIPSGRR